MFSFLTHRNINDGDYFTSPVTPEEKLGKQQAKEQENEAGHGRRELDREMLEQDVDSEAENQYDDNPCRDKNPRSN